MKKSRKKITIAVVVIVAVIFILALPQPIPPEVLRAPDSHLREVSETVEVFDEELGKVANELQEVLEQVDRRFHPLAVAAPQIGVNKRIVALKTGYRQYKPMVNPEILDQKWLLPSLEGCFSLEGRHLIKRYYWHKIGYQDLNGEHHEEILKGFKAAIFQQEIDHLNGILISDL